MSHYSIEPKELCPTSHFENSKFTILQILFLRKYKPWGVILFARNIKSVDQTKKLTNDIKKIFKDFEAIKF